MAAIFASKRNQKKGSSLGKAPSHQFRPVLNSTQCSRDRLGSSTETRVKGEVTHVRRQQCLPVCDYVKARGQPREPLHRVSKQELGDQVISATAPPSTRPIRHGQAWTRSSLQHESPSKQPPSLQSSREVDHDSELDSSFDMDSSTPPSPSDLEALRETWEQVRLHNTKISKVSAPEKYTVTVVTDRHLKFTPAPSRTRFSWSEDGMLRPRGGGINFGMTVGGYQII